MIANTGKEKEEVIAEQEVKSRVIKKIEKDSHLGNK